MIYFPSFSVGSFGSDLQKNYKIKDKLSIRFYSNETPTHLKHPYFLVTGGHFYKHAYIRQDFGFESDNFIMGDSGGFQVSSGKLKLTDQLTRDIFHWLENNFDISINLDIPPIKGTQADFNESLDVSYKNFKYFNEHQTGKTFFLNVLHGKEFNTYSTWYNKVKDFDFSGWSIGSSSSNSLYKLLESILILIEGKEHFKDKNKFLHILGTSKLLDFTILCQIQKSLKEIGSNLVVMTDSSTPSRQVVYGCYHIVPNFKNMQYTMIHIPKVRDRVYDKKMNWIGYSKIDDTLGSIISFEELFKFDKDAYDAIVLHNLYVFIESIRNVEEYIENRKEYGTLYKMFSSDIEDLLDIVDELIKSDKPMASFSKYKPLLSSLSSRYADVDNSISENEFFTF